MGYGTGRSEAMGRGKKEAMKGKNGILLLLLAALVLGPILWQITPRAMVTPEEADETAELCLGEGDPWLAGLLTLTDPEEIRETLEPFTQKRFRRGMPGGGNLGGVWLALYREDGSWITNLQLDVTARCKRARDNYHPAGDTEDLEAFYQALCARLEAAE